MIPAKVLEPLEATCTDTTHLASQHSSVSVNRAGYPAWQSEQWGSGGTGAQTPSAACEASSGGPGHTAALVVRPWFLRAQLLWLCSGLVPGALPEESS